MDIQSSDFKELVGENLSGVTFVQDYLQLQFNPPPILNVYTPVTVYYNDESVTFGDDKFANLIIAQINKIVNHIRLKPDEALEILFHDNSVISISLLSSDYGGPEAINLFLRNGEMIVL